VRLPVIPAVAIWLWLAFILGWLALAQFNKKASRTTPWRRRAWAIRLPIIVAVLIFTWYRRHIGARPSPLMRHWLALHPDIAGQWLGVGLILLGFACAFWARLYLGRNWGMPMSLREGHELVTSGPYAYVRHPIYSGLILATIGSTLAVGLVWVLPFVLSLAYFIVSARTEEQMMITQFPDTYPAYRRRTKMLIPFVL
jgi:protein-S-isoprenylcysteine O-methyltransferase Ste14